MPATIAGIVFNDINRNGTYNVGETGIDNVSVTLLDTTSNCSTTITNVSGVYSFTGITIAGTYRIYETVTTPAGCPPTNFTQPSGYDQSTTQRVQSLNVTSANISGNATLSVNFGHEVITSTIPCTATAIQFTTTTTPTNYINIDLVTGNPTNTGFISPTTYSVNGIGYSRVDNLIYGYELNTDRVVRVQGNRVATQFPAIANLPIASYTVGDVNVNGYLYLYGGTGRTYIIDVDSNRSTFLKLVDPANGFQEQTSNFGIPSAGLAVADFSFRNTDGQIYGFTNTTGAAVRVNPITGTVTNLTTVGIPAANFYGATFATADGSVFAIANNTGRIYKVTITGNTATGQFFSQSVISGGNDGAMCASADLPIDFGDCPDTTTVPFTSYHNYRSTLAKDGPRHGIIPNLVLGTGITAEPDALQNPTATGDSLDDGIGSLPLPTIPASVSSYIVPITVTNNTGRVANIYAWLDFNNNGSFQGNESYTTTVPSIVSGTQLITLTFNKPANTTIFGGLNFIRMRITTDTLTNANAGNLTLEDTRSYGPASNGEVEDYPLYITNLMFTDPRKTADTGYASVGDTITYTISIPNQGSTNMLNVRIIDTIPNGSSFVSNSLTLNSVTVPGANPQPPTGYLIGTIPFGLIYTVTYKVLVQTIPSPNNIVNNFQLFYDYLQDAQTGTTVPGTATPTTPPSTTINTARIAPIKTSNLDFADINDTIIYTVGLTNTGNATATSVVFIDTIPNGTSFVNGSFSINGVTVPGSPNPPGINIGTIPIGPTGITTVSFRVTVVTMPSPNPIPNSSTTTFNYTENPSIPNGATGGSSSNIDLVTVSRAIISMSKSSNPNYVGFGTTITYSVSLNNIGTTTATNVVFIDTIPSGTNFVNGSFSINNTTVSGSPNPPGINIGTIPIGITTVSFKVIVITIPSPNPIPNSATANFNYTVDPSVPNSGIGSSNSNINQVNVTYANLLMNKISNPLYAQLGSTITYTVLVTNNGNTSATNVLFIDTIPNGTGFVNGSFSINSATISGSPNPPGINIGTLPIGVTTLSFNVTVNTIPTPNPIPNNSAVRFNYTVDPSLPDMGIGGSNSNTAYTQFNQVKFTITKSVDKSYAVCSDVLTYTFRLTNIGNVTAANVLFYDTIPSSTQFVNNSFMVNNITIPGANPTIGVNLDTISAGSTSTITFKVIIIC